MSVASPPGHVRFTLPRLGWVALAVLWFAHALQVATGPLNGAAAWVLEAPLPIALVLVSAAVCLLRPVRRGADRLAWTLLGLGLAAWACGDLYYLVAFADTDFPPLPSLSDGLWLGFYPAAAAALILLARNQLSRFHPTLLVDGAIAGLAVSGLCVALLWNAAFGPGVDLLESTTLLSYQLGDAALLGLVTTLFALVGWRPGRTWALLGIGLAAIAAADALVFYLSATNPEIDGTALDALFPGATLLLALAAWQSPGDHTPIDVQRWSMLASPGVFSVLTAGLLVSAHFTPLPTPAVVLAAATFALILARAAMTFGENLRLVRALRVDASTDHLTGLANRRAFEDRLAVEVERARRYGRDLALVLLDLDHFKRVNDTHGHPAGDAVLGAMAVLLRERARAGETVARVGGEEFAWLLPETDAATAAEVADQLRQLVAQKAFPVPQTLTISAGVSELTPAGDARELYRRADVALYGAKTAGRDRVEVAGRRMEDMPVKTASA